MAALSRLAACTLAAICHIAAGAPLVVGQVAPLSGPESAQAKDYAAGMKLAFAAANRSGGLNGNTLTLVSKDDGGRPEETVRLTRELLADQQPIALAGYVGGSSMSNLASSGLLENAKLALVGYRSADVMADIPLAYSVRAGIRDELKRITEHLRTIGVTSVGLLYEDGPGAAAQLALAEDLARKANGTVVAKAAYEAGTSRVADAVDLLVKAKPQAIIMLCSGAAGARFIEQYRANGGSAQLFAHSGADMERIAKRISQERLSFVTSVMRGVAIVQVVPNPYEASKLGREITAAAAGAGIKVSYVLLEGYIAGKVIVEAVRRQGARPSREGMAAALDSITHLDLGGYIVSFAEGARTGSKYVELTIISDTGKIRQ